MLLTKKAYPFFDPSTMAVELKRGLMVDGGLYHVVYRRPSSWERIMEDAQ